MCRDCYGNQHECHPNKTIPSVPRINKRKSFEECSPATKTKRRREGHAALERIGVPPEELITITPESLLSLSTSVRKLLRAFLPQLHIPSEKLMIRQKLLAAAEKGTTTASCLIGKQHVAYLTEPLKFIDYITNHSSFISIGLDKGNDTTKLGISYERGQKIHYAALMVSTGDDTYENLMELKKKRKFSMFFNI